MGQLSNVRLPPNDIAIAMHVHGTGTFNREYKMLKSRKQQLEF